MPCVPADDPATLDNFDCLPAEPSPRGLFEWRPIHAGAGFARSSRMKTTRWWVSNGKPCLLSAVDRLVPLCGECQRIALSATVNPEGDVAGVIGGFMIAGDKAGPRYIPLKVARCREHQQHRDGIHVRIPDAEKRPSLKVLRLGFDTIVAPRSLVRYRRTGT
jgi:hypothetical protein